MLIGMMPKIEHEARVNRKELEEILFRVAAGDKDALALLYDRVRTAVYAMALSVLKNTYDAQDVTQDTFVRVWENAPRYHAQGSPMAWILTIARNLALMKLRQSARNAELEEQEWNAIPASEQNVAAEDRYLLQDALAMLSDQERKIVMLYAVSGLKHREIAELLELPLATVLSKYHRALKKLRMAMKGDDAL